MRDGRTLIIALLVAGASLAGCDAKLGRPQLLWLLWLVPALVAFFIYAFTRRRRALARLAAARLLPSLLVGDSPAVRLTKAGLLLLAVTALVLALAEPKIGYIWEDTRQRGTDLVIAVDLSDSMLVEDGAAGEGLSRLARAKREITDLVRLLEGDRIAIVGFAGAAFVQCPLTIDYDAAMDFVDGLDTESITLKGTALGAAVRTSLQAFQGGSGDNRAIILITDGEDTEGAADKAAEEAKAAGVRIYAIGIGRDEGAPIPESDGGFRRDTRGEMVLSKLDEPVLQRLALTTGGSYVRSVTGDMDLETIYRQGVRAALRPEETQGKHRQRPQERLQWFIAVAALALVVEALLPERRWRMR